MSNEAETGIERVDTKEFADISLRMDSIGYTGWSEAMDKAITEIRQSRVAVEELVGFAERVSTQTFNGKQTPCAYHAGTLLAKYKPNK